MTRRCSICAINYPAGQYTCPVCDEETTFFSDLKPHEDWEARVQQAVNFAGRGTSPEALVASNRLARFRKAGLDLGTAMEYAAKRDVDLHLFEHLCEAGCPVETATRIVAPLT